MSLMHKVTPSRLYALVMPLLLLIFTGHTVGYAQSFDTERAALVEASYPDVHGYYLNVSTTTGIEDVRKPNWSATIIYRDTLSSKLGSDRLSNVDEALKTCTSCVITRVIWTFKPEATATEAGSCHINMGCPEALSYVDLGESVCRITALIDGMVYYSSGVLVNNTANDGRPLLLTAEHNGLDFFNNRFATQADLDQWLFYFRFETNTCNGLPIPLNTEIYEGATLLARSFDQGGTTGSDFALLEILDTTFNRHNHTFSGWSRALTPPQSGVSIHHPMAQLKRISFFQSAPSLDVFDFQSTPIHWKVFWSPTQSGHGTTEPGSSGAPLYDENNRIVGNLSGGFSSCDDLNREDYYGAFFHHWDMNGSRSDQQLAPWLDPLDINPIHLDGKNLSTSTFWTDKHVSIYPNPANTRSTIFIDHPFERVEIFNQMGQLVSTSNETIITPEKPGMYQLKIYFYDTSIFKKLSVH